MYIAQQEAKFKSYILSDPEPYLTLLHEDTIQLNIILNSNSHSNIRKAAQLWIDILQQVEDFISVWMDCQKKWIYLSAIYVEYIALKMDNIGVDEFMKIHSEYNNIINGILEVKNILLLLNINLANKNKTAVSGYKNLHRRFLTLNINLDLLMKVCHIEHK